ncbi:MAG: DNA mismatch repair endonuclease MutL [Flavobacteriia bacterium]|jgi:DNA mismatch repair protein MutL|nr:DNA mismatch repair endonuclease MutL [Cryomorphaceae bacterium]
MSIINLLPDHIANQIAAGEVIQRPASVVKELLENAVDAGATHIQLIVKDAGKTLIQVLDNGNGMDSQDAENCFLRHATSKLQTATDLFALQTKGFRGEALASIAAIAHVCLKTKQENQDTGIQIEIEGNQIKNRQEVICNKGASFEVKNLFYNVPARRNFLKSDAIELGHIQTEFERVALAHPELHMSFQHNGQDILQLPAGNNRMRIAAIFGKGSNEKLVPIEEQTDIVRVNGYIGKPEMAKKSRGEQYLFVNQRFFKDPYFHHAITKAYDGMISEKHHASYCIFLEVDPQKIDVNIHPTKTEIKFEEDRFIYSILLSSVRQALGKHNIFPTLDFESESAFEVPSEVRKSEPVAPQISVDPSYNPFQSTSASAPRGNNQNYSNALRQEGFGSTPPSPADWQQFYQIEEQTSVQNETIFEEDTQVKQFLLHDKYLVSPTKSGFLFIDIRRAKNRILFDELIQHFVAQPLASQQLLFPIERTLAKEAKLTWQSQKSLWTQLGFGFEISEDQLQIMAVPTLLSAVDLEYCIDELTSAATYSDIESGDIAHFIVAKLAFIGSKNYSIQHNEEVEHFIETLFQSPQHTTTPNGKPIMFTLGFDELAKKL